MDQIEGNRAIEELSGELAIVAGGMAGCRVRQPEIEVENGADEGIGIGGGHDLRGLRRAAASCSLSRLR